MKILDIFGAVLKSMINTWLVGIKGSLQIVSN